MTIRIFFALTVLIITLSTCNAYGSDYELPSDVKNTFEDINEKYNTHLKWDDALAAKAMVEAVEPDNHGDFFETRNSMLPTKRYMGPPEEKVCLILLNSFKKYADKTDAKVQCQCKVKQCAIETKGDSRNCDEGGSICPDGVKVE